MLQRYFFELCVCFHIFVGQNKRNMKNSELYHKTVDILVQAYFNDTLVSGHPCGCAIGNIVAANKGLSVIKEDGNEALWSNGVSNPAWGWVVNLGCIDYDYFEYEAKEQILSTGYSVEDVALIEITFERNSNYSNVGDAMFNGLMAVIDALDIIHENTDANVTSSTKQKFTNA